MQILASGGIDEHEIERLIDAGAPIDGFGGGSSLAVSTDVPVLDSVYNWWPSTVDPCARPPKAKPPANPRRPPAHRSPHVARAAQHRS